VFTGERMKVLHSAVVLANELPRSKLITFTRHGFMAQGLALLRPSHSPIIAFTPDPAVLRQLRLLRAVEPYLMALASDPNETIENALALLLRLGRNRGRHRHHRPGPTRGQRAVENRAVAPRDARLSRLTISRCRSGFIPRPSFRNDLGRGVKPLLQSRFFPSECFGGPSGPALPGRSSGTFS
jgi:hypothetical protein